MRTLTDGLGSADASATSPDHGVALEPMAAERIEIVRGPAALLYGGNAVGGVVNAVDGRIPDYLPADGAHGTLDVALGTAADERSVSASADGGLGPSVAWHVDVSSRKTDDVEIPGLPAEEADHAGEGEDDPDEEVFRGVLENSSIEATNGSVGLSWIGTDGFLGVSLSGFESDYGVPGHGHGHGEHGEAPAGGEEDGHEEDEDAAVRIDLEQRRLDLAGQWNGGLGPFRGVRVRAGASEYEHAELEGDEVGTRFTNDAIEARVDLVQRRRGSLEGSVGVQASRVDFGAFGEEAFVPPSLTTNVALFTLQEISRGPLSFQLGGRIERQEVDPEGRTSPRSFTVSSASAGAIWAPFEGLTVGGSLSRSERAPTSTELFAFGPHAATRAFEIGDPDLDAEVALGTDLSIRGRLDRFAGSVSVFYNRFDGYIYESFTGETEDGLDVIRFEQRDADLFGLEAEARFELVELPGGHLEVFGEGDLVRAELRRSGDPLPRIPPARLSAGFDLHHERWGGSVAVRRVFEQDRIAANEDTTPAHTLVDASLSYRLFARQAVIDLVLRGTNLTDELALVHTSFLKNEAPLPGRDFRLAVRVAF